MLEIKQLYKRYGKFTALDHIDLTIEEGNIFGFVGPNGAGKTTTMRILATLMAPSGGDAWINGVSVTENPTEVRRQIGYMPDFFGVYDNLRVDEYLDFYSAAAGLSHQEGKRSSAELLELVYLSDKSDQYVDHLSRGMKQRLCLARSLIGNPKFLILDEPASGMDARARVEMKMILKTLKDMRKTIMISSHILPELAELCDTFGIIERGQFKFLGTLEEIGTKVHGGQLIVIEVLSQFPTASSASPPAQSSAQSTTPSTVRPLAKLPNQPLIQAPPPSLVRSPPPEILETLLREHPLVNHIDRTDNSFRIAFSGTQEDIRQLLFSLVQQQIPVIRFAPEQENLEDVFLEVTKDETN